MTIQLDPQDAARMKRMLDSLDTLSQSFAVQKVLQKVGTEFKNNVEPKVPISQGRTKHGVKINGGAMKESLGKSLKKSSGSFQNMPMKMRVGYKRPGGNAAHLVDLGTQERYTKRGLYRGKVTPRGFHSVTFAQNAYRYGKMMIEELTRIIINYTWK